MSIIHDELRISDIIKSSIANFAAQVEEARRLFVMATSSVVILDIFLRHTSPINHIIICLYLNHPFLTSHLYYSILHVWVQVAICFFHSSFIYILSRRYNGQINERSATSKAPYMLYCRVPAGHPSRDLFVISPFVSIAFICFISNLHIVNTLSICLRAH